MSLEPITRRLPDYAKDIRLNLESLAVETSLTVQQRAGVFVAAAIACRNATLIQTVQAVFGAQLSPEALSAARAAAAIMAMNNIYYRFIHDMGGDYATMRANLRMSVMAQPGVDQADFHLYALAVSVINGCAMCVHSHEKSLREHGLTREQVQTAVRIAAVLHAVATVLDLFSEERV